MIAWAASGALSSLGCGYVVKFVGRIPIFVFGSVINFSLILTMLFFWSPDPSRPEVFFVVAGFWAISNSVWTTSLNGMLFIIRLSDSIFKKIVIIFIVQHFTE